VKKKKKKKQHTPKMKLFAVLAGAACAALAAPVLASDRLRLPLEAFDMRRRAQLQSLAGATGDAGTLTAGAPPITFSTFSQRTNHFAPGDFEVFQQRYVTYDYSGGSSTAPVFLYLGGEGPVEMFVQEVYAKQLAEKHGAVLYFLEHRFYGMSVPNSMLSTDNLERLLNVDQALADASAFLGAKGSPAGVGAGNVVLGCSYSGCLSGWFKMKYGSQVLGAYAPSGPVLAQTNFTGYLGQFDVTGGAACAAAVRVATKAIASADDATLATAFKSCDNPLPAADRTYFLWTLAVTLAGEAQEDLPPNFPVAGLCQKLVTAINGGEDPLQAYADVFNSLAQPSPCTSFSEQSMIASLQSSDVKANYDGTRAWYFQKCNEFGFWKSSYPGLTSFEFSVPVEHLVGYCQAIFGIPGMTPNTTAINERYHGKSPVGVPNVLVTQGSLDPWHLLGVTPPVNPGVLEQANLYAAGHCAPLHADTDNDPPSLQQSRELIATFIAGLLAK
jgi:serine protease 16